MGVDPGVCSERLHEVSLGAKIVADRGAVLALFASLLDELVDRCLVATLGILAISNYVVRQIFLVGTVH